jgi:uncharacterized membrane protein
MNTDNPEYIKYKPQSIPVNNIIDSIGNRTTCAILQARPTQEASLGWGRAGNTPG